MPTIKLKVAVCHIGDYNSHGTLLDVNWSCEDAMRVTVYWRAMLSCLILLSLYASDALAQNRYRVEVIGPSFLPNAINDRNQVTGMILNSGELRQIGIWEPGGSGRITILGNQYDSAPGINNAGQIAVTRSLGSSLFQAAILDNGSYRDLGSLGGNSSVSRAINSSGEVTGLGTTASGETHAFKYSGGTMVDLGTLGGSQSAGNDINDRGQVVGSAYLMPGNSASEHAFLYSDGRMTDLGSFGGNASIAMSINNAGQIAAYTNMADGTRRGFMYENGVTTWIGPGLASVTPFSINNAGEVVGTARGSDGGSYGFLFSGGTMSRLSSLLDEPDEWDVYQVEAINDSGSIIGWGCHSNPVGPGLDCAGLFMSPVPEPATWMLWTGALLFGWTWRRLNVER